jgi:hypothetical protein
METRSISGGSLPAKTINCGVCSGLTTVHRTQSQSHGDVSRALSHVSRDRERQRVGYFLQRLRGSFRVALVLVRPLEEEFAVKGLRAEGAIGAAIAKEAHIGT